MMCSPSVVPLNMYAAVYDFMLKYGYLYAMSLVLASIVYFHALISGIEPPMVWAFLAFAVPFIGALLYVIYFVFSWKNLLVSREEREKAREIVKKWEDTPLSEETKSEAHKTEKGKDRIMHEKHKWVVKNENVTEPYRKR